MRCRRTRIWRVFGFSFREGTNRFESLNLPSVSSLIATSIVVKKSNVLDKACFYKVFAFVWIRLGIT